MKGITFANQVTTDKNLGAIQRGIMSRDGVMSGCVITHTGANLTIGVGYMVLCGRVIHIDTPMTTAAPTTHAYAQLVATIDLTQTASLAIFNQVVFSWVAGDSTTFPALTQDDINGTGTTYAQEIAVVSVASLAISGVARSIATTGVAPLSHLSDTANPHGVTAAQAGALPTAGGTMTGALDVGSGDAGNVSLRLHSNSTTVYNFHAETTGRLYIHRYVNGAVASTPLVADEDGKVTIDSPAPVALWSGSAITGSVSITQSFKNFKNLLFITKSTDGNNHYFHSGLIPTAFIPLNVAYGVCGTYGAYVWFTSNANMTIGGIVQQGAMLVQIWGCN